MSQLRAPLEERQREPESEATDDDDKFLLPSGNATQDFAGAGNDGNDDAPEGNGEGNGAEPWREPEVVESKICRKCGCYCTDYLQTNSDPDDPTYKCAVCNCRGVKI